MSSTLMNSLATSPGAVLALFLTLIAAVSVTIITSVCVLGAMWRSVRVREEENDLKREMVARGLSADDIVRVLGVSSDPETIREQRRAFRHGGRAFALSLGAPTGHN